MRSLENMRGDELSSCLTVQPLHILSHENTSHFQQPGTKYSFIYLPGGGRRLYFSL